MSDHFIGSNPRTSTANNTVLVLASVHTRNFHFEAVGRDEVEAEDALLVGWEAHRQQYGADPGLMHQLVADGEVDFRLIEVGWAYRDAERLGRVRRLGDPV